LLTGFAMLAVVAIAGLAVLGPRLLPGLLEREAAARGIELSIAGARINWLARRVTLLDARLGEPRAPALAWESVEISLGLAALLRGSIRIEGLRMRGVRTDLAALEKLGSSAGARGAASAEAWLATLASLELEALELPWLSRSLDAPARIERAACRDLARVALGEEGVCDLRATVGDALIALSVRLSAEGDALRYHASVRADGLELERWQRLLGDGPTVLQRAVAYVAGTVSGRFVPGEGLVDATGQATLTADEVAVAVGDGTASGEGVAWNGDVQLAWSAGAAVADVSVSGSLSVDAVRAATPALTAEASALRWRGAARLLGRLATLEGTLQGERLGVSATDGGWSARFEGLSTSGRLHRDDAGLALALDSGAVRTVQSRAVELGELEEIVFDNLSLQSVSGAPGEALVAASVSADRLVSSARVAGPGEPGPRLRVSDPSAVGVSLGPDGALGVQRLVASVIELRDDGSVTTVRRASASAMDVVPSGVSAAEVAFMRLEALRDDTRTSYEHLVATDLQVRLDGSLSAREQVLERMAVDRRDGHKWSAREIRSSALRRAASGAMAADEVHFVGGRFGGEGVPPGAVDEVRLTGVAVAPDGRLGAEQVELTALRFDVRGAGRWDARGIVLLAAGLDTDGRFTARRAEVDTATLARAGAYHWTLEGVIGERVEGPGLADLRAHALSVAHFAIRESQGRRWDLTEFRANALAWRRAISFDAADASVERAAFVGTSGLRLEAAQLVVRDLDWQVPAMIRTRVLDLGSFSGTMASTGRWLVESVTTRELAWDDEAGVLRARSAASERMSFVVPQLWELAVGAPRLEDVYWRPGELPGMRVGATGEVVGTAGPRRWRLASSSLSGGVPEARRLGLALVRGVDYQDSASRSRITLDVLRLDELMLSGDFDLVSAGIQGDHLRLGSTEPDALGHLSVAWLRGAGAHLALSEALEIDDLVLSGVDLQFGVERDGTGVWPLADPRRSVTAPDRIRLGEVRTGGNATVTYLDRSVDPAVEIRLAPVNAALSGFDTARPGEPAGFELRALIDGGGTLELGGRLTAAFGSLDVDSTASVRGLDLTTLSSWSVHHHGVRIVGGRADADMEARVRDRQVDGVARLLVTGLDLAPPARDERPGVFGSEGAKMRSMLGLLEDPRGRIELQLPLEGSLDDPTFRLSGALAQGFANTTANAALVALRPIGLLVDAVASGFSGAHFPPIEFAPGEVSLSAEDLVFLEGLATTLAARPRMQIRLCGKAGPADRAALKDDGSQAGPGANLLGGTGVTPVHTSTTLARQRAAAARSWLLGREGVRAEQLPACEPEVETQPDAGPRVDVVLARTTAERVPSSEEPEPGAR
jgi:hypothetical protein